MSWLFASGGQSVRTSASASVLPMKIQGCFPLAFTGLISLRSKRLSRVFSILGRQRLWKPPGSCFRPCGPRASEREGPGREPVPCRPALLVQLACPPHPHRGLLSRQMRHFINCILNTCFKLVKALSSFQSLIFSPFAVAACFTAGGALGTGLGWPRTHAHRLPGKETPGSQPPGASPHPPPAAFPEGLPV